MPAHSGPSSQPTIPRSRFPKNVFASAALQLTDDAGCGTGEHALFFAARGHAVTGFDFLEEPIAAARRKAAERSLIENRADDLIGGGLERRLGFADVPGRAAGVRAAKVFAVVGQDVVREKTSLSLIRTVG